MKTTSLDYEANMHISDGILKPEWVFFWSAITVIFVALGIRIINKRIKDDPVYLPRIALLGAVVFVISVWHIPVPVTGSSSHPVGTPMASIIIGPFATVVISAIALFFQSFVAHGGITTIGANTFSMGVVGALGGYYVYRLLKDVSPIWFCAGMAGLVGSILTYLTTALQLALSLNPGNVMEFWKLYSLGFIPTQLPLAFAEFAFTGYVIKYIHESRVDVLKESNVGIDSFTKIALLLMVIITSLIVIGSYIGYSGGGNMAGVDRTVEQLAAPDANIDGIGQRLMAKIGEPVGFAFVGLVGGLFTGYFWIDIRRKH